MLVAAIGVDGEGNKNTLALVEEETRTPQRSGLLDKGLARASADGAKTVHRRRRESVWKAIRRTFGSAAAIQRCQIHKASNIRNDCGKSNKRPRVGCCARLGSSMMLTRLKNRSEISRVDSSSNGSE